MEGGVGKEKIGNADELLAKLGSFKLDNVDLSSPEDLSIAVMNLISIEEHLYFTAMKTGAARYLDTLKSIRELRAKLLRELIRQPEGELWCTSKHLLAASMRLMEVGTKYLGAGKKKEANEKFLQAFDLYSLFWGLNLGQGSRAKPTEALTEGGGGQDQFGKLRGIIGKIIDCCKE